ncbi:hypothetical protein [Fodinibius sp. AD559]|uniref:hypothetical protein n=1 Tax=Fodinibius sp. AD559 TaxID=3424179 RepID=UPI004046F2F3
MNSSSYDNLDFLQTTVPFNPNLTTSVLSPQSTDSKKTKFGSILNDLSSFLTTAADSAVTVDGIINGRKNSSRSGELTPQQQMALMQTQRAKASSGSMTTALIIGGIAIVGGTLMFSMLKKKNN